MKLSLKFRDDQRPLARAKIPISIIGIPFIAGAAAGNHNDLLLDLTTAFDTGPAFRVCYRPNDPSNPFSFAVKTGIGAFGSPIAAPMSMITEFNLLSSRAGCGSPAFSVVFKPRFGDFCFRKTASSPSSFPDPSRKSIPDEEMFPLSPSRKSIPDEEGMFPPPNSHLPFLNGIHANGKANGVVGDSHAAQGGIRGLVSGIEVTARSSLPVSSRAEVGFRWGVRLPTELQSSFSAATFSVANLPMLVMNKISIRLMKAAARSKPLEVGSPIVPACELVEACKSVRRDLEGLRVESETLRKAVEDIRDNISCGSSATRNGLPALGNKNSSGSEAAKSGWRGTTPEPGKRERQNEGKSTPGDVNEELKKVLMGAHSTGK